VATTQTAISWGSYPIVVTRTHAHTQTHYTYNGMCSIHVCGHAQSVSCLCVYIVHKFIYSCRVDWVELHGTKYCVDDVIWYGYVEEVPKLGKIFGIFFVMPELFFALRVYETMGIDQHYHSIVIEKSTKVHLEIVTEDSQWIGKQHSIETHTLQSCKPGTYHIFHL